MSKNINKLKKHVRRFSCQTSSRTTHVVSAWSEHSILKVMFHNLDNIIISPHCTVVFTLRRVAARIAL